MTRPAILLIGAGRFAEELSDIADAAGRSVVGWIEGLDPARASKEHEPRIWWVDDVEAELPGVPAVPAIGSVARRELVQRVARTRPLVTLVHPAAVVARTAELSPGAVLFAGTIVGARSRIGFGTIVNRAATIGHHTEIGMHSFIGPGASIAGGVTIGDGVRIGMGALVRDDITIGDDATIGMGAVCIGDVAAGATMIGNPARPMDRS
jgi:sugar O-acyltransferase (sialic acid O-acetyltransferase NeuD family)